MMNWFKVLVTWLCETAKQKLISTYVNVHKPDNTKNNKHKLVNFQCATLMLCKFVVLNQLSQVQEKIFISY